MRLRRNMGLLMVVALLLLSGVVLGKDLLFSLLVAQREVSRLTSPDNKVDAVLVERNVGATTSYSYHVYIVPKGTKVKRGHEKFIADKVSHIKIEWLQSKLLQISYEQARIFHYSNFWQSREVDNFEYIVEIRLKPTTESFSN